MIQEECRVARLKLVDRNEDFNDLIEWKLYQLHKPVHGKVTKSQKASDVYSSPTQERMTDVYA